MPPATGLRAHIELARISGFIVCETFKVAPRNLCPDYPTENIEKALVKLEGWKLQLSGDVINDPQIKWTPTQLAACCIWHTIN